MPKMGRGKDSITCFDLKLHFVLGKLHHKYKIKEFAVTANGGPAALAVR